MKSNRGHTLIWNQLPKFDSNVRTLSVIKLSHLKLKDPVGDLEACLILFNKRDEEEKGGKMKGSENSREGKKITQPVPFLLEIYNKTSELFPKGLSFPQ